MTRLLLLLVLLTACDEPDAGEPGGGGSSSPSTCGVPAECQGENTRYQRCVQSACDTQFRACYGPDYASGIYNGGPCSAWQACIDGCGCNQTCQLACGQMPLTCNDCVAGPLAICLGGSTCAPVQCVVVDASNPAVGGCNRLALCCASLFDSTQQVQCNTLYQNLSPAGDEACQSIIPSFCRSCLDGGWASYPATKRVCAEARSRGAMRSFARFPWRATTTAGASPRVSRVAAGIQRAVTLAGRRVEVRGIVAA